MISDWEAVTKTLPEARKTVSADYHPAVVAEQWRGVLSEALSLEAARDRKAAPAAPVRLNLGCGGKLLPGYVNIDVADSRDGVAPDMVGDVLNLSSFEDGSVDEVLSVHMIEHLSRWDVPGALKEWARVLKPGGRIVIECPNLLSACEALIANPESAHSFADDGGQTSMWPIYGAPVEGDPLMLHRWGYTPESLSRLLEQAGLVDVGPRTPQFKLGAPRDMRVEGTKPGPRTA